MLGGMRTLFIVTTYPVTVCAHEMALGDFGRKDIGRGSDQSSDVVCLVIYSDVIEVHLTRDEEAVTVKTWVLRLHTIQNEDVVLVTDSSEVTVASVGANPVTPNTNQIAQSDLCENRLPGNHPLDQG
jgi:hypothetical protein